MLSKSKYIIYSRAYDAAYRKSQNTTRMASADKTTSSAGKAQRAAKSNEPDPDDLSYLQTQAPNKGDDDDEEETDGGASATDDMDTAATDGEDEKQQVEPPTPVQAKSKSGLSYMVEEFFLAISL